MKYILLLIIVLLLLSSCNNEPKEKDMDSEECIQAGGRIANTISETCSQEETNIGEVVGVRCPCVCCVPN